MDQATPRLDEIGIRFKSDKSSHGHNYLAFYETYFENARHQQLRVLEIGLLNGASLSVWEEYFPNATIFGADIDPSALKFTRQRVSIEILDQSNIDDLIRLGTKRGPFDIIIENGSHMWGHKMTTLKFLFPFLRDGGCYIVNDLETNFGSKAEKYSGNSSGSCVDYIKKLVDLRVADSEIDISREEDPFLRTYGRNMESIVFSKGSCLLKKISSHSQFSDQPIVELRQDADRPEILLVAHIGGIGDKSSTTSSIRTEKWGNIQGFTIYAPRFSADDLRYRARLANGAWTNWLPLGSFAGAAGRSENLTGFSVRLEDSITKLHNVTLVGLFREDKDPVLVGNGEDCVSRFQGNELFGMQIILERK